MCTIIGGTRYMYLVYFVTGIQLFLWVFLPGAMVSFVVVSPVQSYKSYGRCGGTPVHSLGCTVNHALGHISNA